MSTKVLQEVDDELTFVVNERANLSIEVSSGVAVLQRQRKSGTWGNIETYKSGTEDIVYSGGMHTNFRLVMIEAGLIEAEVW